MKKISYIMLLMIATTLSTFAANGNSKSVKNSLKKPTVVGCASGAVYDETGTCVGHWYSCSSTLLPIIVWC
jgi:hypothetical protein